ncbi:FAD-binding oxidoreductase [Polymorphobacter sp. PAMC 29334]|uniref:NAD(P)/FAD-dependent oxidoreductase n=1 Tax=Polymorphobacter sp. PAMC 29334 TaxID=2862331 RepID=UPI001C667E72|nr:FAD-binding oxidoreductase [Polymorphobacter sp. PAMC 29334]QYE35500.1 FAD-binding oxidoreductase [Polymorphobacter sp. PAMC 29334]
MTTHYDIAIVGAGIAGASLAYFLGTHGAGSIVLLEAEDTPGYHTTGRSAAFWEPTYGGAGVVPLSAASRAFFDTPPPGFAAHPLLSPRGALHISAPGEDGALAAIAADFDGFGVETRVVDAAAMAARYPIVGGGWERAGLLEPDCHDIDVAALHAGFLSGAKRAGAVLVCSARVERADRRAADEADPPHEGLPSPSGEGPGVGESRYSNTEAPHPRAGARAPSLAPPLKGRGSEDLWHLATTAGDFTATTLVDAAGAWGDHLAALAGVAPLGLTPLRRTMVVLDVDPAPPADLPVVFDAAGSFYFKPDGGRLWLSPHDEIADVARDAAPEELDIAVAIDRFEHATTARVRRVERSWAGLRTFSPDRNPVYGFDTDVPGFFWCVGQGGFGIQTAPAAGDLAARALLGLPPGSVDPAAYAPGRLRA